MSGGEVVSVTTPINGFVLPSLGDIANIESAVQPLGLAVDSLVLPRFSTTAGRDAAISAPTFGQFASVSGTQEVYKYNGTAWVSACPRWIVKPIDEPINLNATGQLDDHLLFSMEANSAYVANFFLGIFSTSATPDIKMDWTIPAGGTRRAHFVGLPESATTNTNAVKMLWDDATQPSFATTNGFICMQAYCYFTTGVTAGNANLRWAQNVSDAAFTTVGAGSRIEVWKVG